MPHLCHLRMGVPRIGGYSLMSTESSVVADSRVPPVPQFVFKFSVQVPSCRFGQYSQEDPQSGPVPKVGRKCSKHTQLTFVFLDVNQVSSSSQLRVHPERSLWSVCGRGQTRFVLTL
jgi:hypothetical protein